MDVKRTKPTPGKWHANGYGVFAGNNCIAVTDTDNASGARYEANARLMASAPDMMEALAARREAREFAASVSAATPDGEPVAKHLMDKADLLFAKAARLEDAALAKIEAPTA